MPPLPSPPPLRVVTWNVGRLYTPTSNNRLADADVPRVARALAALAPDVVLLQEIASRAQFAALRDLMPGFVGEMAERCGYDRQVAALARPERNPSFEQHRLEPTGRGLVTVTFDFDGARAAALAVHLDVRQADRKRSQVEGILAIAAARVEPLALIGGDFNLDPVLAKRLRLKVESGTFDRLIASFSNPSRDSGPTCMRLLRIDHWFVSPSFEHRCRVHVSRAWRLPWGDHEPLVLDAR